MPVWCIIECSFFQESPLSRDLYTVPYSVWTRIISLVLPHHRMSTRGLSISKIWKLTLLWFTAPTEFPLGPLLLERSRSMASEIIRLGEGSRHPEAPEDA